MLFIQQLNKVNYLKSAIAYKNGALFLYIFFVSSPLILKLKALVLVEPNENGRLGKQQMCK